MDAIEILRDDETGMVHVKMGPVAALYEPYGSSGAPRFAIGVGTDVSEYDAGDLDAMAAVLVALRERIGRGTVREYVIDREGYGDGL
jgi:hypothetical protein